MGVNGGEDRIRTCTPWGNRASPPSRRGRYRSAHFSVMVEPRGIEPRSLRCHRSALPLSYGPVVVLEEGIEPSVTRLSGEARAIWTLKVGGGSPGNRTQPQGFGVLAAQPWHMGFRWISRLPEPLQAGTARGGTSGGSRTHNNTGLSRARLPSCATLAWWSRPPGSNQAPPAYETGASAKDAWPGDGWCPQRDSNPHRSA